MRLIPAVLYVVGILSAVSESTNSPSYTPTPAPTFGPSPYPSPVPTHLPTNLPTTLPTPTPTFGPTPFPSPVPTSSPTYVPTSAPTVIPSITPTASPTHVPTPSPTVGPSIAPTASPSGPPSHAPTGTPSYPPSFIPTHAPTQLPSPLPTYTLAPTTFTPKPTLQPTPEPTAVAGQLFAVYNKTISVRNPKIDSLVTATLEGYPNVDGIAWGNVAGTEKVFWTDSVAGTVSRANFDLSDIEVILTGLEEPRGIHIGVGSPWMFITGNRKHGITRATINGTRSKDLATTVPGITGVCHAGPWVYFTSSSQQRLYRMNKDGDQFMSIYDFEDDDGIIGVPMDVTYLPGEAVRPWAGPGQIAEFKLGHVYVLTTTGIVRMGPEGTKANVIVSNITSGYAIDINIAIGKLYFSDSDVGVYQCNLHGGGLEVNFYQSDVRGISLYTSSRAMTYAPSENPTRLPTPYPTFSYVPSIAPTQAPTPLPTPQPTYIFGTILFSAGEDPKSTGPFAYVTSTDNFIKMNNDESSNVHHMEIMRNEGEATLVVYTDSTLDAVFSVPLINRAQTLPTLLYKGCNDAGALSIPRGTDYIYVACRTYPLNYSEDGEYEIVRISKSGGNATTLLGAGSVGPISAMSVTDNYIYYTTVKGKLKLIALDGSGLKHLVTNLRDPSGLIISRETYFGGIPIMYVSTKNAIWRISMDGKDITKIVEGLWDCRGISLDLSHGRILWADYLANGIFSTQLDGSDFRTEVNVHKPNSVIYYVDVISQKTGMPSGTPSETPTPEPTFTRRPTPMPTHIPSHVPTSVPTYYPGRIYVAADGDLYESEVGSLNSPKKLFDGEIEECRGITTTSDPPYVYFIDAASNNIYKAAMDSETKTLIYSLTGSYTLYDISASDNYLFVSGNEDNSIIKMDLDGTNDEILVSGIPDCKGLDVDTENEMVYFASNEENTIYSVSFNGGTVTNITSNIENPNGVVVDAQYSTLYVITEKDVWLVNTDGSNHVRLMSGFDAAFSASMQYGQHRLWIADEDANVVYQAELTGHSLTARMNLTAPKYISFYSSTGSNTPMPTFSPSHGPSQAPSQYPTEAPTTPEPTGLPSSAPTQLPSESPTQSPTPAPSSVPSPVPTVTPSFLFYAVGSDSTNGKIIRSYTDGTGSEDFVVGGLPTDLAVDADSKYLFWTDADAGEIYRTQVGCGGDSGTCGVEVILSGLTNPTSIAVSYEGSDDVGGPHVFWTDPTEGKLYRCNKDGTTNYRMIENVEGISGVAATYQYVFFTMEDNDDIYRVDYTCGADDDDCVATPVLIGVCDKPAQLSYSPQTMLMYAACADSILNVKTFIQTGDHSDRIEIIIDKFQGSNYNDVVYSWDSEGLFIAMYNESTLYFMPNVLITDSFDDDDASDDDKAFVNFESELTTVASSESVRSVAIFDSGVLYGDGISLIAQNLIHHPERLFATIDDDGTTQLTDSRIILSSLESISQTATSSSKSGSVLASSSHQKSEESSHQEDVNSRDLHADFAASAAKADEHVSTTPVAAAAGAVAMFAGLAIASRKRRGGENGKAKKKKQRKQQPAANSSRAGYTSLD